MAVLFSIQNLAQFVKIRLAHFLTLHQTGHERSQLALKHAVQQRATFAMRVIPFRDTRRIDMLASPFREGQRAFVHQPIDQRKDGSGFP